jgi:hypothetical protein
MKQQFLIYNKEKRGHRTPPMTPACGHRRIHGAEEGGVTNPNPCTRRGWRGRSGESEAWEARGWLDPSVVTSGMINSGGEPMAAWLGEGIADHHDSGTTLFIGLGNWWDLQSPSRVGPPWWALAVCRTAMTGDREAPSWQQMPRPLQPLEDKAVPPPAARGWSRTATRGWSHVATQGWSRVTPMGIGGDRDLAPTTVEP